MNNNRSDRSPLGNVILILCLINILLLLLALRAGSSFREHFIPGPGSAGREAAENADPQDAGDGLQETASEATTEAVVETTAAPTTEAPPEEPAYDGIPSIELADTLPALSQNDLEGDLVKRLSDSGALTAQDGYGEDLTPQVRAEVRFLPDAEPFGTYRITLRAENRDGKEASAKRDVSVEIVKPILELDTYELTLNRGDAFNSLEHVITATDIDGNRDALFRRINVDGDVNTYTAGTYEVRYRILSMQSDADATRTLTVIVR